MGIYVFLGFVAVVSTLFYLLDTYQHRKVMLDTMSQNHWNDKLIIEQKNEELKEKYPNLYGIVNGFLKSEIRFNSKEILNNIRPVRGTDKKGINEEITAIFKEEDKDAAQVVAWYFVVCVQIDSLKLNSFESVNELNTENKKIQNGNLEGLETKEVFCFS